MNSLPLEVAPWILPIAGAIDDENQRRQREEQRAREAQQSVKGG